MLLFTFPPDTPQCLRKEHYVQMLLNGCQKGEDLKRKMKEQGSSKVRKKKCKEKNTGERETKKPNFFLLLEVHPAHPGRGMSLACDLKGPGSLHLYVDFPTQLRL